MTNPDRPIAEWGMYPFASVRSAWDELWDALVARVGWLPPALAHTGDVHARWADPACVVHHVCGWPLARTYADTHRVLGAFALTIPEADGHRYRSTLVSPFETTVDQLVERRAPVVANNPDSLSGWISLLHATVGVDGRWPGDVRFTGAHIESLRALGRGDADLACIDSWSLALIEREEPALVERLHRIGHGPWIPTPGVTVRSSVDTESAAELSAALVDVLASDESASIRQTLLIERFVPLTIDDYRPVLDLHRDPSVAPG